MNKRTAETEERNWEELISTLDDPYDRTPTDDPARWECATCGGDVEWFGDRMFCKKNPKTHRAIRLRPKGL
jgi:hypothetical protein